MNKILSLICLVILAGCNPTTSPQRSAVAANAGKEGALNGLSFDQAAEMVKRFQSDTVSKNVKSNVWLPEAFVDNIYTMLKYEGADGIRIYFAKDAGNNMTLVIVSTKDDGKTIKYIKEFPKLRIHKDYFEHNSPLYDNSRLQNVDDNGRAQGTTIYTDVPCEEDHCVPDSNYVSCADAKEWAGNFKAEPLNTKSVWFSLAFINKLRLELEAAHLKGKFPDGIRIYFVKKNTGRHSLVIVTTRADNNAHRDYFECYEDMNKNADPEFINKFFDVNNHGEECPVFCEGTTWDQ